ncbi:hypothetical protein [Desulfosediminicola flagellatus]|uniref:hypothetical protein n=1 Tax=Desulfosediminicola flagellatus TaxID=2569541 RepID=UPI00159366E1|nr:hypothetical protein [Desulfosediminicola flagellatus]
MDLQSGRCAVDTRIHPNQLSMPGNNFTDTKPYQTDNPLDLHELHHKKMTVSPKNNKPQKKHRTELRIHLAWQRMMASLLFVPAFFSILTLCVAIRDKEVNAVIAFGISALLFGAFGTYFWFRKLTGTLGTCMIFFQSKKNSTDKSF